MARALVKNGTPLLPTLVNCAGTRELQQQQKGREKENDLSIKLLSSLYSHIVVPSFSEKKYYT